MRYLLEMHCFGTKNSQLKKLKSFDQKTLIFTRLPRPILICIIFHVLMPLLSVSVFVFINHLGDFVIEIYSV